jgi:uncharacterized repeat protein (TIGR03803 family)
MSRKFSAFIFAAVVLLATATAQTPAPAITQLVGFPCDATLTKCPDGSFLSGFIESPDGNFYAIASEGGKGLNAQGTVFKITPSGQLTVLYNFAELPDGSLPNGASPDSLVEGTDGFLYGTTLVDGGNGLGSAFRLSKTGTITLLHSFCNTIDCHDGANPAFLTQGIDGQLLRNHWPYESAHQRVVPHEPDRQQLHRSSHVRSEGATRRNQSLRNATGAGRQLLRNDRGGRPTQALTTASSVSIRSLVSTLSCTASIPPTSTYPTSPRAASPWLRTASFTASGSEAFSTTSRSRAAITRLARSPQSSSLTATSSKHPTAICGATSSSAIPASFSPPPFRVQFCTTYP